MNEALQKHIAECEKKYGQAPSLEVLNQWIGEFVQKRNSTGLPHFEGYSPQDMFAIIHGLWEVGSPVKMRKLSEEDLSSIPLFRQVKCIVDILLRDGQIKLTATKAIPPKIVRDVYELGIRDWMIEDGVSKLSKETDSESVMLVHVMLKIMKIVKEQKGVMTLTKTGEKIAKDSQKLFEELLRSFTCSFNFAYFDGYGNEYVGGMASGFSLILVSKYGSEKRSYKFYSEKYFKAFPDLLKGFDARYSTIQEQGAHCYSLRTFERFMLHFGLVEIEKTKHPENETYIAKTPLFDKVIEVLLPKIKIDYK